MCSWVIWHHPKYQQEEAVAKFNGFYEPEILQPELYVHQAGMFEWRTVDIYEMTLLIELSTVKWIQNNEST